ncbi:MAG TPA: CHAP domain-containing protein [Aliidongia sp.]|nr:CHAP domain-containing protein [Aliidongia sp.]
MSCVAYVKATTDFGLSGNAWSWWENADSIYQREHMPAVGSVMVFNRTHQMPLGHVAVVSSVSGPREIRIDHANWHRSRIDRGIIVHDVSEKNDWSEVSVQWQGDVFGNPTPVNGFIYPSTVPGAQAPHNNTPRLMLAANQPLPSERERHHHGASVHQTMLRQAMQEQEMMRRGRLQLAVYHPAEAAHHAPSAHHASATHHVQEKKRAAKH